MRLSLSLQMDVLKAKAGHILNTFKVLPRRDVLFFEDIFANYVRECEKAGFGSEMLELGKKWNALGTSLVPPLLRKLAPEYIANSVVKHVWVNLGLLDDLNVTCAGNTYSVITKTEFITRIIGENSFMRGFFVGAAAGFHKCDAVCSEFAQTRGSCQYTIKLLDRPFALETKAQGGYSRLNEVAKEEGLSLKHALLRGFFRLDGHRITFRGKTMVCLENTGFHLIGRSGVLLDRLSDITTSFFGDIVQKDASCNSKLVLLKNILQACGWGCVTVTQESGDIRFLVEHPAHGMQAETDNWDFLTYFILGYLHVIDKKIVLDGTAIRDGVLSLRYSKLRSRQA